MAKELNKLFKQIKGTTEENAVATMAVRSMAKAYYTTDNIDTTVWRSPTTRTSRRRSAATPT